MAYGKCIICGNDAQGALVEDTRAIKFIRAVKQRLNMAQNNTLVVCAACAQQHAKKRKNFEQKLTFNLAIGVGIVLLLVVLPPILGGTFSLSSLFFAPLLALFIVALPMLDYVPPIAKGETVAPHPQQPAYVPPAPQYSSSVMREEETKKRSSAPKKQQAKKRRK